MSVYPPAGYRTAATVKAASCTDILLRYFTDLDNSPLFDTALGADLLPTPGGEATETERFRRHYIVLYNPGDANLYAIILLTGTFSRYTRSLAYTYYYRVYLATGTTGSPPPTQPAWSETMIIDRSFGAASADGWYDDLYYTGFLYVTVPPGRWFWIRLRGTSWASASGISTSIGFKRGNVTARVVV